MFIKHVLQNDIKCMIPCCCSAHMLLGNQAFNGTKPQGGQLVCHRAAFAWFYLLPLLLPAGGFLSWRRGPPAPKPAAGGFDTPKVSPADGLMPGLLKLKPELLLLPNPENTRGCTQVRQEIRQVKEE